MKTKYVEPAGYFNKDMEKAFKAGKKEAPKKTPAKGTKKSAGKKK